MSSSTSSTSISEDIRRQKKSTLTRELAGLGNNTNDLTNDFDRTNPAVLNQSAKDRRTSNRISMNETNKRKANEEEAKRKAEAEQAQQQMLEEQARLAEEHRLSLLSLRERLEHQPPIPAYSKVYNPQCQVYGRMAVNETLVSAYELHSAVRTLQSLLSEDTRVSTNPYLVGLFQSEIYMKTMKINEILSTPTNLLVDFEQKLIELVQYQINHGGPKLGNTIADQPKLTRFVANQRMKRKLYFEGKKFHNNDSITDDRIESNIVLLGKLNVDWHPPTQKKRSYEEYMIELRAYKAQHGHIKVRRITPGTNLGEWIHRMRKEYDMIQCGETIRSGDRISTLNEERIKELEDLGMIWKIRHGRPKKGDARFRLRRKNNESNENDNGNEDDGESNNNTNNDNDNNAMADATVMASSTS